MATILDQGGLSARMIADQLRHDRIPMTHDVDMGGPAVAGSVASALEGLFDVQEAATSDSGSGALKVVS